MASDDDHSHTNSHDHTHDLSHGSELSDMQVRVRSLETVLSEKGYVDPAALDAIVEAYETRIGPHNGAQVVARAWSDPVFREALLEDATKAVNAMGNLSPVGSHLIAIENTEATHHMVVCTLCSCYPWEVLGLPPTWYKSAPYRSRAVIEPREVLVGRNFGGPNPTHLTLNSRPWPSLEKFHVTRKLFDEWRTKQEGVLKTPADWERWQSFQTQRLLRREHDLTGSGDIVGQAKRMFLKAYANKLWGLPGSDYRGLAEWLTEQGYPTSETDIKNAKRGKINPEQLTKIGTPEVKALITILKTRYPIA